MANVGPKLMNLDGKSVLLTGGNSGIGRGIFEAFAEAGANVAIMGRNDNKNEIAVREVKEAFGGDHISFCGNVANRIDCERVVKEAASYFGKLDVLINDAGISRHCRTFDYDEDLSQWYDVMNVNLNGLFQMCFYSGRVMRDQGYGCIVNISSMSAVIVNVPQWQASYNSSKAAVNHLTRSLAAEWAEYNIRVNAIAPGYVMTDILPANEGFSKGFVEYWNSVTPMKRFADRKEIAALALFLASDAASYCTGSIFTADGGYSLAK